MAATPLIIKRRSPKTRVEKNLIIAVGYREREKIRSFTLSYRLIVRLLSLIAATLLVTLFFLIHAESQLYSSEIESLNSGVIAEDSDLAEDIKILARHSRSLRRGVEQLLEQQEAISKLTTISEEELHYLHRDGSEEIATVSRPTLYQNSAELSRRLYSEIGLVQNSAGRAAFYDQFLVYIPHRYPLDYSLKINSPYGLRQKPSNRAITEFHKGIDLKAKNGTGVRAAAAGKVKKVKHSRGGYGRWLVLEHEGSYETLYAHLSEIYVTRNQHVRAGEVIGAAGSTGNVTGPHLHYEIKKDGRAIDPTEYILP